MASRSSRRTDWSAEARDKARLLDEERQRRSGRLIKWGVVAAAAVIAAVIALIVVNSLRGQVSDTGPAPRHGNEYGGITLLSETELAGTGTGGIDTASLPEETAPPGEVPPGVAPAAAGEPIPVVSYVDVNCVFCAAFEAKYTDELRAWLDAGDITLEYRTVAFLDRNSTTDYSSRGAGALACVADSSPARYLEFTGALYTNFESGELDDDGLAALAEGVGAGDISACLSDNTFRPWVDYTTQAAELSGISGTPTVYVDGQEVPDAVEDFATVMQDELSARG
ncbi:thioredoxin domain-containing protein [Arthrobacter sp. Br18]|uniref:DsbA family protein n=1 Tax=Arthrobacter sp. Br18 TaxID=1312954 RepID=UPI00047AE096|nr:thioredoxin domain-containing protein [Arthrobacter sp. Br18]